MHNKPCLMWQITITIKPFAHPIYLINHDTPCDKDKPLNFFKRKLSELKNRLNAIFLTGINEPDSRFLYCLGEKSKNILFLLLILCVHQTAEWKATLSDNHVVSKALFSMNAGSWKDCAPPKKARGKTSDLSMGFTLKNISYTESHK